MRRNAVSTSMNASEKVFKAIMRRIDGGDIVVGSKLPSESVLCREYGVSRVTVRAALQRLQALGLIKARPGGGTYLQAKISPILRLDGLSGGQTLSPAALVEMCEFRRDMDSLAAEYAAQRATDQDIRDLEAIVERMARHFERGEYREYSECDMELHVRIGGASHNSFIKRTLEITREMIRQHVEKSNQVLGMDNGYGQHRAIIDAIRKRNAKAAAFYAGEHADVSRDSWMAMLRAEERRKVDAE